MFKKILMLSLCAFMMVGCANTPNSSTPNSEKPEESTPSEPATQQKPDWKATDLPQFDAVAAGSPLVTLHTTKGDIKIALFPQAAPLTVENFVTHCENGYYDNVLFHRVIKDFMIQTGDPEGTGAGGESIWGEDFADEPNINLRNFYGSISMANAGYHTNGSQFFINQSGPDSANAVTEENRENLYMMWKKQLLETAMNNDAVRLQESGKEAAELQTELDALLQNANDALQKGLTDEEKEAFKVAFDKYLEVGGNYFLDFKHTVFGQVVEGMDVVEAIAAVETAGDRPTEEIKILSTTVEKAK